MAVTIVGNSSTAFPLHDTNQIAAGSVGFVADATGTFEGQLADDTADKTIPVTGGQFYPFELKYARSTAKTGTTTELLIIYGKYK
jgi:hypothetical protein